MHAKGAGEPLHAALGPTAAAVTTTTTTTTITTKTAARMAPPRQQRQRQQGPPRASSSPSSPCPFPPTRTAFVGQRDVVPASEYHDADFSWEEHASEARPLLEARLLEAAVGGGEDEAGAEREEEEEGRGEEGRGEEAAEAPSRADYFDAWEAFHARDNGSSRFYKERRYLPLAFPALADEARTRHVFELGCGAGSALLPVLRANAAAVVSASDVSPRAVAAFLEAARSSGLAGRRSAPRGGGRTGRVAGAFALDATSAGAPALVRSHFSNLLSGSSGAAAVPAVDAVLLVFTLGALDREGQVAALRTAAAALRAGREGGGRGEGGGGSEARPCPPGPSSSPCPSPSSSPRVLVRDHGLFDLTHLRAPRRLEGNLHSRSDGTLCYFFSPGDLAETAKRAGLRAVACRWATVERRNRRTGQLLRRVFVHGEFELDDE